MVKKKLYVLTGFLGAGKTTMLMNILEGLKGRKMGIIQNEFGKAGIDGEILKREGLEMIEINRGSIFCTCLQFAFVNALLEMGKLDVEYVFVESSGLADPSNIDEILKVVNDRGGDMYEFKGAICLIDGVNFLSQLPDTATVDRQLAHCHMAVINKIDLIDEHKLSEVMKAVRDVNPICRIIVCRNGEAGTDFLNEDLLSYKWAECEDTTNTPDNKPKTISLVFEGEAQRDKLTEFLKGVLSDCYRIKGFFKLTEGWRQVDVVEDIIDFKPCEAKETSQLVFLSKIGPNVIRTVDREWRAKMKLPMKLKN